jgi:hypothetical protein
MCDFPGLTVRAENQVPLVSHPSLTGPEIVLCSTIRAQDTVRMVMVGGLRNLWKRPQEASAVLFIHFLVTLPLTKVILPRWEWKTGGLLPTPPPLPARMQVVMEV